MAITNAQQAKQLLAKGGRIGLFKGAEADARAGRGDISPGTDRGGNVRGGNGGNNYTDRIMDVAERQRRQDLRNIVNIGADDKREELVERFRNKRFRGSNLPGFIGMGLNLAGPLVQKGMTANRNFFLDKVLSSKNFKDIDFESLTPSQQDALYGDYMSARLSGEIDAFGNKLNQGDDSSSPLFPLTGVMTQAPSDTDQEPEVKEEGLFRRFRADGGIMNSDVVGGEMDFESARQMYGLGKLVKKVTRSVKKIAKSPIGKIAIAAGLSGIPFGGGSFFGPTSLFGRAKPFLTDAIFGKVQSFGTPVEKGFGVRSGGLFDLIKKNPLSAITAASAVSGLLTAEEEDEAQQISDNTGIDIEEIRANPNKYLSRRFRAEGGSTEGKEPVAKKVMPLLDMDGKEKDYRETGGFVDMGRMEKADDVPARLSKNEFVFTADAVRNAGDGSVDKGAEVMYNMMKNLEAGGDVSEESQGMDGARKMFQTSQRLEEVL